MISILFKVGASKVAIDTAKLLNKNKFNVYFFSAVNKKEEEIEGITYITTNQNEALKEKNKLKGIINGLYNFKAKKSLKQLLQSLDNKNTIIHVHGWTKALSSSIFDIAFKMNFKVVVTLHDYFTVCPNGGYFDYKKNEICKRKPLSWNCIKCNCDSRNSAFKIYRILRQFIQNKIVKLPQKLQYAIGISDLSINVLKPTLNSNIHIEKLYNPIEFDSKNQKIDYKKNEYFLYVGRINKEKGVDVFCKAITELGLKGIVVGDGSEKELLEKNYPSIEFTGWKSNEEVKKYMMGAKALIFPSLWYEGAPLTPLEILTYGIPTIAYEKNSATEHIEDKKLIYKDLESLKHIIKEFDNTNFVINESDTLKKFSYNNYMNSLSNLYNFMGNENILRS